MGAVGRCEQCDESTLEPTIASSDVFKTELCPRWSKGHCEYGSRCQFAHGSHELRDRERSRGYKTRPCEKFANGYCWYGKRCQFAHGNQELQRHRLVHAFRRFDDELTQAATSGSMTSSAASTPRGEETPPLFPSRPDSDTSPPAPLVAESARPPHVRLPYSAPPISPKLVPSPPKALVNTKLIAGPCVAFFQTCWDESLLANRLVPSDGRGSDAALQGDAEANGNLARLASTVAEKALLEAF